MPFDGMFEGENPFEKLCTACRAPIRQGEPETQIDFPSDPDGSRGLSGPYHRRCSKPFESLARAARMTLG